MAFYILHRHGTAGPKKKKSYLKFGKEFSSEEEAKDWARENLIRGKYKFVPKSKVKRTKLAKDLFYL